MPTIKVDKKTLTKVKKKTGIYSSLSKQPQLPVTIDTPDEWFIIQHAIRESVLAISEKSFKSYAKAHGCQPENMETEWNRYRRILTRYL